jgi:hypothetical protein
MDYHYLMLVVPVLILARDLERRSWVSVFLFVLAILLVGLWAEPEQLAQVHPLLAYPRLYGALILWGLVVAHRLPMPANPNLDRIEITC